MKLIAFFLLLTCSFTSIGQTHHLEKLWQTDTVIAVPESILPDFKKKILYISLIDGPGWIADGKGGVGRMNMAGKNFEPEWITGLHAPKGMGLIRKKLYVADMSQVIVIDTKKGRIKKRINIDSAKGLNDITITDDGIVFVSDSRGAKIWKLENDKASLYIDTIKGVNGLKAIGNELYIGAGKNFMMADRSGKLSKIAELPQGIDGIEPVGNGDFILTAWAGYIFYVSSDGRVETLLESAAEKMNTADIGYDQKNRILYVPTFNAKKIIAYRLK